VLAVKHKALVTRFSPERLAALGNTQPPLLVDVKSFFRREAMAAWPGGYWQL